MANEADDSNGDDGEDAWWEPPKQDNTCEDNFKNDKKDSGGSQQKFFICMDCVVTCSTSNHPNRHILASHSRDLLGDKNKPKVNNNGENSAAKEKRFSCVHCGAEYWWKKGLSQHIREKHPDKYAKNPLHCSECNAAFIKQDALDSHILNKHSNKYNTGVNKYSSEPKPDVLCVECGVTYRNQITLDKHILAEHSSSLKCEKCDFATGCKEKFNRYVKSSFMT